MTKKWYFSKTIWVAVISVVIAGIEACEKGANPSTVALAALGTVLLFIRPTTDRRLAK